MDAYSGYNKIMTHEDDKPKTSYIIEKVQELLKAFHTFTIQKIPRAENTYADAQASLGSALKRQSSQTWCRSMKTLPAKTPSSTIWWTKIFQERSSRLEKSSKKQQDTTWRKTSLFEDHIPVLISPATSTHKLSKCSAKSMMGYVEIKLGPSYSPRRLSA